MIKALVVIDLQNDITKNYRDIINSVNVAIQWAEKEGIHIVYIQNENLTAATRTFKRGTRGFELVPEMNVVSDNIFVKSKTNALTSIEFSDFIAENNISEFIVCGADAIACVKSTCYNMRKKDYSVTVLTDCVTSYDKKKLPEMFSYYESKGCILKTSADLA
ncbi:MAG: cysteine hydrolase [Clostridia bacterium]|nr:cysteine hydrolase [Clostridia bacterium]MCQ2480456.1 cysteine hydrolase [Clostridia bacterium]